MKRRRTLLVSGLMFYPVIFLSGETPCRMAVQQWMKKHLGSADIPVRWGFGNHSA